MSKALESRTSAFAIATQREVKLTHYAALAYHTLYKCQFDCTSYQGKDQEAYFRNSIDLKCEDSCFKDFLNIQLKGF